MALRKVVPVSVCSIARSADRTFRSSKPATRRAPRQDAKGLRVGRFAGGQLSPTRAGLQEVCGQVVEGAPFGRGPGLQTIAHGPRHGDRNELRFGLLPHVDLGGVAIAGLFHARALQAESGEGGTVENRADQRCFLQVGGREVGVAQVGSGEVGVPAAGFGQVGADEAGICEARAFEVGSDEGRAVEGCTVESGVAEVGVAQAGIAEVGTAEVGAVEKGVAEVGAIEAGGGEVGGFEVDACEVGSGEVCAVEDDAGEVFELSGKDGGDRGIIRHLTYSPRIEVFSNFHRDRCFVVERISFIRFRIKHNLVPNCIQGW